MKLGRVKGEDVEIFREDAGNFGLSKWLVIAGTASEAKGRVEC
jgi:hypothetical protein